MNTTSSDTQVDFIIAQKTTTTLFDKSVCKVLQQLPLPGVVILVHGVNSDGEWYEDTERGLCAGLNNRLARNDAQLVYPGIEAGKLATAAYRAELTSSGFIDPKRNASTFITSDPNYSPVIRFRWGYKANADELREFGQNVWLNEQNYWGGGPFANGCSALPDLWGEGLNAQLFLWLTAQHLNPTASRDVYSCPPRAYYVHAAWRLAKLIELIRSKQADIPVTIVCHSQGNMVAMAAAFLGDSWPEVTDRFGKTSRPVADTYVLCNPPYCLHDDGMGMDNWAQRGMRNTTGETGRQTARARVTTFQRFAEILRQRAGLEQPAEAVNQLGANRSPRDGSQGYEALQDRKAYGLPGVEATKGRVTLYCNPADQVISASTVQGIGWMGVPEALSDALRGVFTQRVWAQGYEVGRQGTYHYWRDHWCKPSLSSGDFWHPPSPPARYSITKGMDGQNFIAKLMTVATAPVMYLVTASVKVPINATPPKDWQIPVNAPALPPFLPTAKSVEQEGAPEAFDQRKENAPALRNKHKTSSDAADPYDAYPGSESEAPQGDASTEAQLRYEDRARLRMMARREGGDKVDAEGKLKDESSKEEATPEWVAWRNAQITRFMKESIDENATDHSTILTNARNAEKALAYDVAVGYSLLSAEDWQEVKVVADWRLVGEARKNPQSQFGEYIEKGTFGELRLHLHKDYLLSAMPKTIADERENKSVNLMSEVQHG